MLSFKLTPPKSIPVEGIPFLRIQSPIPTMLQTRMPYTRHLAEIRNYYQSRTTINRPGKRANSQLILRYYVDRQLFSRERWQPGAPMTCIGGPQIPTLLDLEAIYTTYYEVRQYLSTTCARVRKMHAIYILSSYGSSSELVVDNNPRWLDGN